MSMVSALILIIAAAGCAASPRNALVPLGVKTVRPVVIRTIPHDPKAFTQGLLMHDSILLESTGLYGKSSLRRIDPGTGNVLSKIQVAGAFAEGIAVMGNNLVQLTWRENTAFVYTLPGLRQSGTLRYEGEGWGLTSDSTQFYMSNGSDTIVARNHSFAIVRRIPVTSAGKPLTNLNELEYLNGSILANVWYSDFIFRISLKDGTVSQVIDCSDIVKQERPSSDDHVLNGIASDRSSGHLYITGKNWRTIYIVRIKS